jgi:hypothetical protein
MGAGTATMVPARPMLPPQVVAALAGPRPRPAEPRPVEWETLAMAVRQVP